MVESRRYNLGRHLFETCLASTSSLHPNEYSPPLFPSVLGLIKRKLIMAEVRPEKAPFEESEVTKAEDRNMASAYQDISDEFPAKKRKKVLLKMDLRIVPMLMLLYCESLSLDPSILMFAARGLTEGSAVVHRPCQHWECENRGTTLCTQLDGRFNLCDSDSTLHRESKQI